MIVETVHKVLASYVHQRSILTRFFDRLYRRNIGRRFFSTPRASIGTIDLRMALSWSWLIELFVGATLVWNQFEMHLLKQIEIGGHANLSNWLTVPTYHTAMHSGSYEELNSLLIMYDTILVTTWLLGLVNKKDLTLAVARLAELSLLTLEVRSSNSVIGQF